MEKTELGSSEKVELSQRWPSLSAWLEKLKARAIGLLKKVKKTGEDDPRRILHSLKVGFALTLVSIFYYVTPLFHGFGVSAMWAVLTVVVVMEYTVGGTLSKGLNRAFATLLAGALGVGVHQIAILSGERGEPILLALFVFLLAAAATFSRFIPEIKARYEYGVTIFILTFSLVTVSSYRVEELVQFAQQRVSTIAIGVGACLFTTIFVFPVWAGEDLHKLVAGNLDKLATSLEGLGAEYFGEKVVVAMDEKVGDKSLLHRYKSVLSSKPTEESLANFARWEPRHGRFGFRHPWQQYLKIGALARQCAYSMEALNAYITKSQSQAHKETEFFKKIQGACTEMSSESSKSLKELALAIQTMTVPSTANNHMAIATAATNKLKAALSEHVALSGVLQVATAVALLIEIVRCTQQIMVSVEELARLAHFKSPGVLHKATVKPTTDADADAYADAECSHVSIDIMD